MPTITIPAASVQYVPSNDKRGGIYVNAVNGRSLVGTIKLEDGTERTIRIRTAVIEAPTNQNTALASADKESKKGQTAEVQNLSAQVQTLSEQFGALMQVLQGGVSLQTAPAGLVPASVSKRAKK